MEAGWEACKTLVLVSVDRVVHIFGIFQIMADHDRGWELEGSVGAVVKCFREYEQCSPHRV